MAEVKTQNDLDFERKHEEDLRRIRDFRLMDDNFMSKVFEDKPCAEFLLRIILNRDDLKVKEVHGQHDLNNIQGRSVRLDILAVDHAQNPDHGISDTIRSGNRFTQIHHSPTLR